LGLCKGTLSGKSSFRHSLSTGFCP